MVLNAQKKQKSNLKSYSGKAIIRYGCMCMAFY
jgi:hypothetical protein